MRPLIRLVFCALVIFCSVSVHAELHLQPVTDAGGVVVEPVTLGDLVFIASGTLVQVHDYSDPTEPRLVYRTARQPTPGRIVGIAQRDDRLFVAWTTIHSTSGVWIFDISEPARPAKEGELSISEIPLGSILQSIAIVGDYLYALDAEAGLRVAHIPTDSAPSTLDRAIALETFPGISKLHSNGTRLIGSGKGFLPEAFSIVSFDLTQPARPVVGDARTGGLARFRLADNGNLGLLIDESYAIIDISDPLKIVERSRFSPPPSAFDGLLVGSVVHVIDRSSLSSWDATDPDHPVPVTNSAIQLADLWAAVATSFGALVIDRADQIVALDLSTPLAPVVASHTAVLAGANPTDIGFLGETPFLLHESRGLGAHAPATYAETARLSDISNQIGVGQDFERFELRDGLAVMANWSQGLSLADVSDPSNLRARGRVDFPFIASLALKGDFAFAGRVTNGGKLAVFNIADPDHPRLITSMATSRTFDVAIRGDLLYSAEGFSGGEGGMWIFDITDPAQPSVLAKMTGLCSGASAVDVDADRGLAALACSDGRLLIIDVSNPTQPQLLSEYASSQDFNPAWTVRLSGHYALFGHDLGLDLVDLRDPRAPARLDRQSSPFFVRTLRVVGERVFSFNALGGMREFRLTESPIPGPGHSAAWFDPARDGEGWMLEMLTNGSVLMYWFTYDESQRQRWLVGVGEVHGNRVEFPEMVVTSGARFGPDFDPGDVVRTVAGNVTLVFDDCTRGAFLYSAFGQAQVIESIKLTRTMRIDCAPPVGGVDDARALQSGSWFDPAFDGQGFSLYWMASGNALVTWYTYDPDGNQYWMVGVGQSDGDAILFPSLAAARGARFGRGFDPGAVQRFEWGSLRLQLGCNDGIAEFDSPLPGFGTGRFALKRLSTLTGLGCTSP